MKEKYWKTLCKLAEIYKSESLLEEHWTVKHHHFEGSDICVLVFKGSEDDCNEISDYLNKRPL